MLSLTLCSVAALSATLFAGTPSTNAYAGETVSHDLYAKTQLTLSLDVDNKYYDGEELKPKYEAIDPTTKKTVTVEDASLSYVKVADADGKSVEPEKPLDGAPKDAGTYRVTYTVTDTDNYLGGSVSQDVRIYRALPNPESPALEPIKFREGLKASEEPFPAQPEDGTWSWTRRVANQEIKDPDDSSSDNSSDNSSDDSKDSPDVVTALAMFTPKDTNNYAVVYRYLKFEVYKDKPAGRKRLKLSITAANKTYDGQPYSDSLVTTTAVDAETGEPVEVKGSFKYYPVKKNNDRDDPWWSIPSSAGGHEVVWKVESTDEYLGGEVSTRFLIEQAPAPTISVNDATGTWRGSEPKYTYTVSGLVPADEGKDVLAEGTKAELDWGVTGDKGYKDLDAGVYVSAITVKNPQLIKNASGYCSNYKDGIFVKAGTLTVAPVTPTTTVTAKNKTYDGAPAEVTCSVTDPTSGEKLDSAYSLTYYRKKDGKLAQLDGAPVDAGSYTVVMNVPARTNYSACEARREFTIAKAAAPTITVKDASGTWRGSEPKYAYTVSGLVDADKDKDVLAEGTKAELDQHITDDKGYKDLDAGVYTSAITVKNPQLNKDAGSNYENGITVKAGTLTIAPVTPTATVTAKNKTYDGAPAEVTCSVTDPITGEKLDSAYSLTYYRKKDGKLAQLDGAPVDAGSYTVVMNVPARTNYSACEARRDFTIAKAAAPTITVKDASVVFGEPEPAYSFKVNGLVGGDKAEDVIAQGTTAALDSKLDYGALDAGEHKDAITVANPQLSEKGAVNYKSNIKVVPGTLTIEPANVTGAIAVEDKTYDGKPVEPAVEIANAAGKKVDASHEVNYYLLDGKERTEDLGAAAPKNAGSYEAVLRVTDTVNYRADEASCTFTISKAPAPTITANDATGTWRDAEPAYTYTVSGLVPADKDKDVLAKGTKAELDQHITDDKGYQGLDTGVYASAITVKDPQLNKDAGANYENAITVIAGTLTVSPLTPKAAVDAAGKTYDGTPVEVTCSVIDPTSGEKLDSSYSLTYYRNSDGEPEALDGAPVDAGSYTVVMSVPARTNYSACEARREFTIAKAAAPTITVKDASVVFGEPEPAYSFKVNGLVGGDKAEDVIAQGTTAALDSKLDYGALDAGEHKDAITVANPQLSEKGAVNYKSNIKVVPGTLTIEPANVTGAIAVEDKTYDGKPVEPAVEIANAAGKKVDASHEVNYYLLDGKERTEDLGAAAPKNAGSYEAVLRVTDTVNYRADEASCTFTISKAPAPTITANDATGTWRGSEPKYVVTVEGLADGETADSVIQSTAAALDFQKISQDTGSDVTSYADLAVGTYADAITVANAQLTDAGKVNYQSGITVIPGTLTVEMTQLTLKLDVASKTYDGAPVTATWSVVDPVTGNALNDLGTLTYYEIVNGVPTKLKEAPTNAGTYLAELSANVPASYTAEPITASFSIYRATPNPDTPQLNDLELRDGLAFADVTIPNDPNGSWSWADGTCAITEAGTESGLAVYTPVDTQNFSRTTCVLSFNVVDGTEPSPEPTPGKPKPTLTIEVTSKVYDGAPASITTEVHDSATSTTEVRNSVTRAALTADGTLTYFEVTDDNFTKLDAAPVNAGHYAVLFEVAETDEYAASSVTTIFDIYRAVPEPQATPHPDPTHPDPALPDLPLTSALKLGDLQLPADDEGTWAWVAPETALTATGTCRFLACYTPNDARNYASVFGWWTFNVVDAAEPDPEPTPSPTPNPTDPGNTKTTKTVTTTTSTTSKIPNTGDRTLAIVASLGIAGGIIVAAALMFIKRRA
ncbi:MBG domain-containing protein [Collinsella aerofaciens]|nr:MBG domain-containing protein [Collinsella aerofaciens]MDB1822496.1 MBG domain-containing protein [Collinsella aerofaciens]MDB1824467.1 MBG domain-containing protein [Collinsella aerofaciens]MDB1826228.1 MBG domain-containing protein [Collinsella aerofaciens]